VYRERRLDRVYPLKDASAYPGVDFRDMVFYLPAVEGRKLRLWMLTTALFPGVRIDHHAFRPVQKGGQGCRWVDFGIVEPPLSEDIAGFGQIKFSGINAQEAATSYFVVTEQTDQQLSGSIEDVEKQLWGISRADVGVTFISPSRVEVASPVVFELIYRASAAGLPEGSYVRFSVPRAFATPQTERKGEDGWIDVLRADFPLELSSIGVSSESHEEVDVIYSLPEGAAPRAEMRLSYRTRFTYLFESTFSAMERRYWYSHLAPLAVAVAVEGKGVFVPPLEEAGHTVRFIPAEAERLHLFLPGRRREGEEIELTGVFTDRYRNVCERGVKMKVRLEVEGGTEREIIGAAGRFTAKHRFAVPLEGLRPGLYRVRAIEEDTGKVLAVSNPLQIVESDSEKPNIYWGEIHGHSEMSDGLGGFEEMFRHARDVGTLDFAASGDHACYFSDNQWKWMQDVVNSFNRPGQFCTLIGYEWAGKQGHRNVYTSGESLKLFRGMYGPTSNIGPIWNEFEGRPDVVGGPHTVHTGEFWKQHNPRVERFLEIYSMWGAVDELANRLLNEGAKLGFTGGGDCHEGRCFFSAEDRTRAGQVPHGFAHCILFKCGITGALMDRLDRQPLIDALRDRRTYATTGARILLDFTICGIQMGDEGDVSEVVIRAEIHACEPVEKIEIIRDGEVVCTSVDEFLDKTFEWNDSEVDKGAHWYYLRVSQADGEVGWTSPIWVRVR